jgi:hypothetical protein
MINLPSRIPPLLFLIFFGLQITYTQDLDWAFHAPGLTGQPIIPTVHNTITKDQTGNIYMTSSVIDPMQFGPYVIHGTEVLPGIYLVASYLAKFSASGEVLWVQTFESPDGLLTINDIVVDADDNLIMVGHATGTISIGPISITTNYNAGEMFLAKFNSEGEIMWARISDSQPGFSSAAGMTVDVALTGEILVGGIMDYHVIFGHIEVLAEYSLFMASYFGNGNIKWARAYGHANPLSIRSELIVDANNDIYWVGSAAGGSSTDIVVFDTIAFKAFAGSMFISRFDSNGDIYWLKHYGEDSMSLPVINSFNLALDEDGIYITGDFTETVDMESIKLTEPTPFGTHFFIAKFDKTGRIDWAKQSNGVADGVDMFDISLNDAGDAFVCGRVSSSAGVSPFMLGEDAHMQSITVDGLDNGFLAKYKADGDLDWMIGNSGFGISDIRAVVATGDHTAVTNGIFSDVVHIGDTTFTASPDLFSSNFYMASFNGSSTTNSSDYSANQDNIKVFPNPAGAQFIFQTEQFAEIISCKFIDLQGKLIEERFSPKETETFVVKDLPGGIYIILAMEQKGNISRKIIVQ